MQIIISPVSGGDNFLLEIAQDATVASLRSQCAERAGTSASNVKVRGRSRALFEKRHTRAV